MRQLPDDNLSYPVLVEISDSSGSGFYFRTGKKLFLVTALHVIFKKDETLRGPMIKLISYDKNFVLTEPLEFEINLETAIIKKDSLKDIVLIELGAITNTDDANFTTELNEYVQRLSGNPQDNIVVVPENHLKRFNDVLVSNDVFILGYPNSLGIPEQAQIEYKKPLLRKGIVAGINTTKRTIILDCPVYYGNSGGLAIEVELINPTPDTLISKFNVIGIVSQYIPFVELLESKQHGYVNTNFENSGYSIVVPVDSIFELANR